MGTEDICSGRMTALMGTEDISTAPMFTEPAALLPFSDTAPALRKQ